MASAAEIFENPWIRITLEAGGVVRIQRTTERLTDDGLASLRPSVTRLVPLARRPGLRLLLDTRQAPLVANEDEARKIRESTRHLFEGFGRHAILVGTAVGRLQANRMRRDQSGRVETAIIFDNEAAALAYLRG